MKMSGLSFDAIPPINVPFRFFLTAPLFAILVSGLLLFAEASALNNRWNNLTIIITHGFTLGFMLMVMIGALFQIFPVVLGTKIFQSEKISTWIHYLLIFGITSLLLGFWFYNQFLIIVSGSCLLAGLAIFIFSLMRCFAQMAKSASSHSIRLAIIALLITVSLGLLFVIARIEPSLFVSFRLWTNIHLLWGLIGWVLLLIMGVSFKIVPMFYVTEDYPKWLTRYLPITIFCQLILISLLQYSADIQKLVLICLTLTTCLFPIITLNIISQRKRQSQDVTLMFWTLSMRSYLIAAGLFLSLFFVSAQYQSLLEMLFAAILLIGFVVCLMIGMLLKIVPFLVWLNLQQAWIKHPSNKIPLSNMYQVISIATAKKQYYLFITLLVSILLFLLLEPSNLLTKTVSILMMLTFSHLLIVLFKAKQLYNRLALELV